MGDSSTHPPCSTFPHAPRLRSRSEREAMVSNQQVPDELGELIAWAWPDYGIARAERHSAWSWTVVVVSQNHHALRMRFNRSLTGRWSMVPVSQDYLDGSL